MDNLIDEINEKINSLKKDLGIEPIKIKGLLDVIECSKKIMEVDNDTFQSIILDNLNEINEMNNVMTQMVSKFKDIVPDWVIM